MIKRRQVALLVAAGAIGASMAGCGRAPASSAASSGTGAPASSSPSGGTGTAGSPAGTRTGAGAAQGLSSSLDARGSTGASGAATRRAAPIDRFRCPSATVTVATAQQLRAALAAARPGQVIVLADGGYAGAFAASANGTADAPIYLCGGRGAILEGRSVSAGYGLHLSHVAHWRISGFVVQQAQKGVVVDSSTDVAVQDLLVQRTGDEGVHLRENTTGAVVRGLTVRDTGLVQAQFGEGIYVGSAQSNWDTLTGGQPDRSDGNFLLENAISNTSAESVDIKEGTTGGVVEGNRFDGTGMTAASAWVNVKGSRWTISANQGVNTPRDGFQTHVVLAGWGQGNVFVGNRADLSGSRDGVGVRVQDGNGNEVACTNTVVGDRPVSNVTCR